MHLIGLTGSIGSGKSVVAKMLAQMGSVVLDADQIAREIVEPGNPAYKEIVDYFGTRVLNSDGTINRSKLGEIVFNDPETRSKLNEITHPKVIAKMMEQVEQMRLGGNHALVVLDVPLLIEAGMVPLVDEVWVVKINEDEQIRRLVARDNMSFAEARRRIAAHMPQEEKLKYAKRIIDNSGALKETLAQVKKMWEELMGSKVLSS